ncbi:hypothetical protein BJ944DRAFT_228246 [Cunninghamella echinulata]|nr:hypothetical protein BJ944DRAFT_228246 [Cunninghamella echinulata]
MSDKEDPNRLQEKNNTQPTDSSVIRYTRDTLLSLHDSPLVCKPDNMPPLSSWFGEEAGSPSVSKSILNSSSVSKSTDKGIVLGPPKTNFASSLYGGLKRATDTNNSTTPIMSKLSSSTSSTSRHRQVYIYI